jgi:hypothetical protein
MNKVFSRYYIVTLFILPVLLIGCNAPSYSSRNNTYVPDKTETSVFDGGPVTDETNVVRGGLGYSFDLTYKELDISEFQVPPEIKKFGEVKKVAKNEFFPIVTLKFTPITGKLYSIDGLRPYPGTKRVASPCYDDLQDLKKTIIEKYPTLKNYTPWMTKHGSGTTGFGLAPRVETKTVKYRFGSPSDYIYPKGRYLYVECTKGEKMSYINIRYEDSNTRELLKSEREAFLKSNEEKILKQKGIDPNKL